MAESFLQRRAADVVADANFNRFVRAVEAGTVPGIPKEFVARRFRAGDGTVEDVLKDIFTKYPQTLELPVIVADIRRVGALEQARIGMLESELASLRPPLEAWYALMDRS
jgi:septation ring formation regulator EzrA